MDLEQIKELLKLVAESGVSEVEIEDDELRIVVRTTLPAGPAPRPAVEFSGQAPVPVQRSDVQPRPAMPNSPSEGAATTASGAEPSEKGQVLRAPIVGTFYSAPSPDAEAYVTVGDVVKPGDVLCIIEAMKLMNEIEAEVGGTIVEILVQNAQPVQYDEPLFVIEP